jgi:hypothetical protein
MHEDETKYSTLLAQFAREELTPGVRQLLKQALARGREGTKLLDAFEFNRFNVVLDFERRTAVAEDDLDVSPAGTVEIRLPEFERLLD